MLEIIYFYRIDKKNNNAYYVRVRNFYRLKKKFKRNYSKYER